MASWWTTYSQPIIIDNYPNEPGITLENQNSNPYNRESPNNNSINNDKYWSKTYQIADYSWCTWGKIKGKIIWDKICECPEWSKNIDWICESCAEPNVCCGIQLNTKVPFIGNCIEFAKKCIDWKCPNDLYKCINWKCRVVKTDPNQTVVDEEEAFPNLMGWLIKILVTIIMLWSFVAILAGGVMISAAWSDEQKATKGKKLIIDVVIALALLGASGVILRLINPSFFQ